MMARNDAARTAAAKVGARRYFTGAPCPAGHVADRYTRNGGCVECQRAMTAANRARVRALLERGGA